MLVSARKIASTFEIGLARIKFRRIPFVISHVSAGSIRLDGPGIHSPVGATFSATVHSCPGAHPGSYTMGTGSLPGLKQPGRGVNHPPPSSAEVKERIRL